MRHSLDLIFKDLEENFEITRGVWNANLGQWLWIGAREWIQILDFFAGVIN